MKNRLYLLFPIVIIALILHGCNAGDDAAIIAGQVIEAGSGNAINNAVVEVTQPENLQQTATTDSAGNFSFDVDPGSETVNVTLEISKQGYETQTTNFKLAPDNDIDDLEIELQSGTSDDNEDDGSDSDEGVGGESGGAASLELINLSSSSISVDGTGGNKNATFTFEVTDSAGRVVDTPTDVDFQIIRGPGGGEQLTPTTATTGGESNIGTVKSNLMAGDSSGTVRVEAIIDRPEYDLTIRSTPVLVSIASGFPVERNFNVTPDVRNFDAYGYNDESHTNSIIASVGDLKGNPVKEGTAVYFSSPSGGLVTGSATTNENGFASVDLYPNGTEPAGELVDVTAQTIDKDNNYIEKTTTILFTTPKASFNINPTTLNITNGGSQTFDVTITDKNGYPMAAGTQISVTTTQGLEADGDIVDLELGDYYQPSNFDDGTEFQVTISDADPDEVVDTDGSFTIIVVSPSGEQSSRTISGSRAKTK